MDLAQGRLSYTARSHTFPTLILTPTSTPGTSRPVQTQEELRAERERGRDALAAQQARARQQLSTETQAAQEHAAAECQRALDALREVGAGCFPSYAQFL